MLEAVLPVLDEAFALSTALLSIAADNMPAKSGGGGGGGGAIAIFGLFVSKKDKSSSALISPLPSVSIADASFEAMLDVSVEVSTPETPEDSMLVSKFANSVVLVEPLPFVSTFDDER